MDKSKFKPETNDQKIKRLKEEREKYSEKLTYLYKGFRGVIHENSASEMRYTTIKVYEAHLHSIEEELKSLGVKLD